MDERNRQLLMQDADCRFFYSSRTNMVHDRLCKCVNDIDERNLYVLPIISVPYLRGKRLCPQCRRRIAIRMGMGEQQKYQAQQFVFFMRFFSMIDARTEDLTKLFIWNEGTLSYVSDNCVQIHVHEDTWRIYAENGDLSLYHNNYEVNLDCTRTFSETFHRQFDNNDSSFKNLAKIICNYTFDYHRKQAEMYAQKVNEEKLQAELAIVDNYSVEQRRSLLHYYYTFVDIGNRAVKKHRCCLRVIETEEHSGYTLVSCRVPKWKKTEFVQAMDQLKDSAFKESRFDYPTLCEELVPQAV